VKGEFAYQLLWERFITQEDVEFLTAVFYGTDSWGLPVTPTENVFYRGLVKKREMFFIFGKDVYYLTPSGINLCKYGGIITD